VTGMTPYTVSLAWNPSTDNSGSVIYTICCANVSSETFPDRHQPRLPAARGRRTFTLHLRQRTPQARLEIQQLGDVHTAADTTAIKASVTGRMWARRMSRWDGHHGGRTERLVYRLMNVSAVRSGVRDSSG
jgi:hypothetical protein